jgi:cytochrome c2
MKTFALGIALLCAGCTGLSKQEVEDAHRFTGGGNAVAGQADIRRYGCYTCHTVEGVAGAIGLVGPPLSGLSQRYFIAGELPNNPENLMRWIQHPRLVNPHTLMPEMNVGEQDSRDIAAYLYILK